MKILWLARTIPSPLDSGDRIYTARLANAVAGAVDRLTFLGLEARDTRDIGSLSARIDWRPVRGRQRTQMGFLFSSSPMASVRHRTSRFERAIGAAVRDEDWDAVILDQYSMAWSLETLHAAGYRGLVAHISHDFETNVLADLARDFRGSAFKRQMLLMNARRTRKAERRLATTCDVISAITEEDMREFEAIGTAGRYIALNPGYRGRRCRERIITAAVPRRVIMLGSFEWLAKQMNLVEFLTHADGAFHEAGIEFIVVGAMSDRFRDSLLPNLRATKLMGYVEDLDHYLGTSRIAVIFEQTGGGFKLKMLDYLFHRVPLFAMRRSLAGLAAEARAHVAAFDDMKTLVEGIRASIDDLVTLNAMQDGAFEAVANRFVWEDQGIALAAALQECLVARTS